MRVNLLNDIVNRLIIQNINEAPKTLVSIIKNELGQDYSSNSVAKRVLNLKKVYGENLDNVNQFQQDLGAGGFDEGNWSHGWFKTEKSSIFIKNRENLVTYDEMRDELIKELRKYAPKYPTILRKKIKDGHMLVVDPADVHVGKLAMSGETGEEYNIEIAVDRCIEGVMGVLNKAQGFPVEKILFIVGNDVLHIDNTTRSTTRGTPQDTDKMWWYAFVEAKKMYVKIIEKLTTIADVHVIYCPSNHDYMSGFMLADTLSSWFYKAKNVTFDVSMKHRKYIKYGINMLEFDHGDGHKEADTPLIMASEQPKMWSKTTHRYSYKHHIHHMKQIKWISGQDYHGVTVEYLRTPSNTDSWHSRKGFQFSSRAVEGFIHHPDQGQICRLVHYF